MVSEDAASSSGKDVSYDYDFECSSSGEELDGRRVEEEYITAAIQGSRDSDGQATHELHTDGLPEESSTTKDIPKVMSVEGVYNDEEDMPETRYPSDVDRTPR
ncbi:hypothetical protein Pmar_PMAR005970, partial [Perkinsus marinus ATCC 50983]